MFIQWLDIEFLRAFLFVCCCFCLFVFFLCKSASSKVSYYDRQLKIGGYLVYGIFNSYVVFWVE